MITESDVWLAAGLIAGILLVVLAARIAKPNKKLLQNLKNQPTQFRLKTPDEQAAWLQDEYRPKKHRYRRDL